MPTEMQFIVAMLVSMGMVILVMIFLLNRLTRLVEKSHEKMGDLVDKVRTYETSLKDPITSRVAARYGDVKDPQGTLDNKQSASKIFKQVLARKQELEAQTHEAAKQKQQVKPRRTLLKPMDMPSSIPEASSAGVYRHPSGFQVVNTAGPQSKDTPELKDTQNKITDGSGPGMTQPLVKEHIVGPSEKR